MKPVLLKFSCFGPYVQEQCIDFEQLERSGLFLICGETGSGKTTILDAMCYALYGRSSGGLRGDLSVMRCKLAEKNQETRVEFTFDNGGKRYRFVRSLKYGRKNLNDSHNCLVLEGDTYVPIFENPKATNVNMKAQELIGLTYDQFRQVIILPQGQFEKLLVSDSAEKEKILVSLFHADRWQKITEELYRRVAEQDALLKQEKLQIAAKLQEYGCGSLPQLEEEKQRRTEHLLECKAQTALAEKTVTQCREIHSQALLDDRAFREFAEKQRQLDSLRGRSPEFQREEALLRWAAEAENIRPQHIAWQEAEQKLRRCRLQVQQGEAAAVSARQEMTRAEERSRSHEENLDAYERGKQTRTLLENAREVYRSLEEKHCAAADAAAALAKADISRKQMQRRFQQEDAAWQQAVVQQNAAIAAYTQAQRCYLESIGSTLAQQLQPGDPCPVCGSREHPQPAKSGGETVTQGELEAKNAAMNSANDALSAALGRRSRSEQELRQAEVAWTAAEKHSAVLEADYQHACARRLEGIRDLKQLENAVQELKKKIDAFERLRTQLQQALLAAREVSAAAQARLDAALEEQTAAQVHTAAARASWEAALQESGLETEERFRACNMLPQERQRRQTALIRFYADLERTEKEVQQQGETLKDRVRPDMAGVKAALSEAESRFKRLSGETAVAEKMLQTATADAESLGKRTAKLEASRRKTEENLDFANRLRGRSGVSLQRYVLGVMLTSITVEANRLLSRVYGGRYRLFRSDAIAGSGHKSGLELEIYDSHTNGSRSVTTLSGGEKFLVALSLAIGLSAVVQAQGSGIRLEAMFIDEGFGSLDSAAVADALDVLQGIQRASGVVGIISHVEQLAQTIPTRLEITKGKLGSSCRICG